MSCYEVAQGDVAESAARQSPIAVHGMTRYVRRMQYLQDCPLPRHDVHIETSLATSAPYLDKAKQEIPEPRDFRVSWRGSTFRAELN
jgi:hypothetical protein